MYKGAEVLAAHISGSHQLPGAQRIQEEWIEMGQRVDGGGGWQSSQTDWGEMAKTLWELIIIGA